jgi:hypothetical protein
MEKTKRRIPPQDCSPDAWLTLYIDELTELLPFYGMLVKRD